MGSAGLGHPGAAWQKSAKSLAPTLPGPRPSAGDRVGERSLAELNRRQRCLKYEMPNLCSSLRPSYASDAVVAVYCIGFCCCEVAISMCNSAVCCRQRFGYEVQRNRQTWRTQSRASGNTRSRADFTRRGLLARCRPWKRCRQASGVFGRSITTLSSKFPWAGPTPTTSRTQSFYLRICVIRSPSFCPSDGISVICISAYLWSPCVHIHIQLTILTCICPHVCAD